MTRFSSNRHRTGNGGKRIATHNWRLTLVQRRQMGVVRHIAIALLLGLSVFSGLNAIIDAGRTQTVVIAQCPLKRGRIIQPRDVGTRTVPFDSAFTAVASSPQQVVGLIVNSQIDQGTIILNTMVTKTPRLPAGLTLARLRVAPTSTAIAVGDTVSLVSPIGCSHLTAPTQPDTNQGVGQGQQSSFKSRPGITVSKTLLHRREPANTVSLDDDATTPGSSGTDAISPDNANSTGPNADSADGVCVLAPSALVMSEAHQNRDTSDEGTIMEFALHPQEAATAAALQEQTPVMVVASEPDAAKTAPPGKADRQHSTPTSHDH